jgi:hypothetical protein
MDATRPAKFQWMCVLKEKFHRLENSWMRINDFSLQKGECRCFLSLQEEGKEPANDFLFFFVEFDSVVVTDFYNATLMCTNNCKKFGILIKLN